MNNLGGKLYFKTGKGLDIFSRIIVQLGSFTVFSHFETGNILLRKRDLELKRYFDEQGIKWIQVSQDGVKRPNINRDGWSYHWNSKMNEDLFGVPDKISFKKLNFSEDIPFSSNFERNTNFQFGGRKSALNLMSSFLNKRSQHYSKRMSSPVSAPESCSRLSPHLTYGTISMKEVYQKTKIRRDFLRSERNREGFLSSLSAFSGRLRWHCHFIQKLEDEPELEWENMVRAFDGLRENDFNDEYFNAWKRGETGYPMIDACMRYLQHHGWINFRMRAMLVSFASYDLWLDWRKTSKYLAGLFIDYEPGIHYSQFQMQSGVTGINSIRIYNPVKQQLDHDPNGIFIRRWLPELENIPDDYLTSPHIMSDTLQKRTGCILDTHYPRPVVDREIASKLARKKIYERKSSAETRREAAQVLKKHGSRRKRNN